jgi:outer membrane protein TolC
MHKTLIIFILLSKVIFAEEKGLDELINIAVSNNPSIQIAKANIKVSDTQIGYARSEYLPQINLNLKATQSSSGGSFNLNQLIYDFGVVSNNIDASKSNYRASLKQLDFVINDVVISIKRAYYDILRKYQLKNVANEAIKMDELQLKGAKADVRAGVRTKIYLTNAKLQLSNSKLEFMKSDFALKLANNRLISILGVDIDKDFQVKRDNKEIIKLAKNLNKIDVDVDVLIKKGLSEHSKISFYEENIKASQANMAKNYSGYFPSIYLDASHNQMIPFNQSEKDAQTKVEVLLKWNLFSGFKTNLSIQKSSENLKISREKLKDIKLKITEDIKSAYLDIKKNEKVIQIQILSVSLATQNLSLTRYRYKSGLGNMVELNNAKLEYTKRKSDLVNSYYSYMISLANLDYVMGSI